MKLYIGCSGFHYDHWKEKFYPEDLPKKEWLEYYSKHFNSVEINNTFYQLPKEETFSNWHERTPGNFRFTVKGSRYITHLKQIKADADLKKGLKRFYDRIEILKGKLGTVLWQLPGRLKRDDERLEKFIKSLSSNFKNVIEFRHESWYDEAVYNLMKKNKVTFCIISSPGDMPEDMIKTTDTAYVRYHGTGNWYRDKYSIKELKEWSEKIGKMKVKRSYVYFNNDAHAYAVKNAMSLEKMMMKNARVKV